MTLAPTLYEIPTLETERLILRGFKPSDVEAEIAFYASDRSQFVGGPLNAEQTWRGVAAIIGHWALRGYGFWALEDKATGTYVGRVGLWNPHGWPEPEIGWTMMAEGEGKGFAHEAALAIRAYGYEVLGWPTMISLIDPDNTRSQALAAKLGAHMERLFENERLGKVQIWRHPRPEDLA